MPDPKSATERVQNAQLLATEAIGNLIAIKQYLATHQATGDWAQLGSALELVMTLDDLVGGDLFRDIRLAERATRRA